MSFFSSRPATVLNDVLFSGDAKQTLHETTVLYSSVGGQYAYATVDTFSCVVFHNTLPMKDFIRTNDSITVLSQNHAAKVTGCTPESAVYASKHAIKYNGTYSEPIQVV
jgi:hypothetical protein